MSDITLDAIAKLIRNEFGEQLTPVKTDTSTIKQTVDSHTVSLDAIAKNTSNWQTEITVMRDKLERYEKAIKLLAEKLNVDVEAVLHP